MSIPSDPPLPPDLAEWLSTPGAPVAGYVRGLLGQIERLKTRLEVMETERNEARDEAAALQVNLSAAEADLASARERDELRLTLAAEQGRAEGAPSEGWEPVHEPCGFIWERTPSGHALSDLCVCLSGGEWRWSKLGHESIPYPTARAAMLAADKATP